MEFQKKDRPGPPVLASAAFQDGGRLPTRFTRDGSNLSPPLTWSRMPEKAESLVLVCDDPDAPEDEPWIHWLIYNIPGKFRGLPEGISRSEEPAEIRGALQGITSFGTIGYDGPSPPVGSGTHHYHFTLYAVDRVLDLRPQATQEELLRALKGHILGSAECTGTYSR